MSEKTRYFKPGIKGGTFFLRVPDHGDIEIHRHGIAISDAAVLKAIDNHACLGKRIGFYEVKSLDKPEPVAQKQPEAQTSDSEASELSIPDVEAYITEENLDNQAIVALTKGDDRKGIQEIHNAAARELIAEQGDQSVVVEGVSNINQLKDYLQAEHSNQGLTSAEDILDAAKNLIPPHEFPNLKSGE